MIRYSIVFAMTLGLTLSVGCGGKDDEKAGKASAGKKSAAGKTSAAGKKGASAAKGDPAVWKDLEIPKLGIVAHVPGNASIGRMGGINSADWKCSLSVFAMSSASYSYDYYMKNIKEGKKGGPLKDMVKNEKKDDDNWTLTWTTTNGKFCFAARKKIGDKIFTAADFQTRKQENHDCTMKMWDSLKAK